MIDLHTLLSDGELIPTELAREVTTQAKGRKCPQSA